MAEKMAKKMAKKMAETMAKKMAEKMARKMAKKMAKNKAQAASTPSPLPFVPTLYLFIIFGVCVSLFLVVLLVLPHRDGAGRLGRGHVIDKGKTVGFW